MRTIYPIILLLLILTKTMLVDNTLFGRNLPQMGYSQSPQLIINEFVTNTENDWVELKLIGRPGESMEVSHLFVTPYYGRNNRIGNGPITLKTENDPSVPYDTRFLVVYMHPGGVSENDHTGDLNGNGYLEVYCNNFATALWNTEGVIAIDTDNDSTNGGMIDFVAYSNNSGRPNQTVAGYVRRAMGYGMWPESNDTQKVSVDIGAKGLLRYESVARINDTVTRSKIDFAVTKFQTPGRDNIISDPDFKGDIFKVKKDRVLIRQTEKLNSIDIPLFIYEECSIRFRVFTSTGVMIYSSKLTNSVPPGDFTVKWRCDRIRTLTPGIFFCKIEAVASRRRKGSNANFSIIIAK